MQEGFRSAFSPMNGTFYKKIIDTGYRLFKRNKYIESGIELKEDV